MATQTENYTTSDGLRLVAEVAGHVDAPKVLLAHGAGQTRAAWTRTCLALAKQGYRAIALDLRGHGESDWSAERAYQISDFANDLMIIANQLGGKPALIGASLGGLSGLLVAGELQTDCFSSLTLVDIAPRMERSGVDRVMEFMRAYSECGFGSAQEAADAIADYMPHRERSSDNTGLDRYLRRSDDGRYRWHWDPALVDKLSKHDQGHMDRMERATAALILPVHLIRGRSSDLLSEDEAVAFVQAVKGARYTDIAGAGHMVVGDRNDAFTSAILSFLQNQKRANA